VVRKAKLTQDSFPPSSSRSSTLVQLSPRRHLLRPLPRHRREARHGKGEDVQVKSQQGELEEVPSDAEPELDATGRQHHHEADQHPGNAAVPLSPLSFTELNLADNSISEYGMHAIKNLISSTRI
jgi:hypothetical protein